jgi:hypothetical protein
MAIIKGNNNNECWKVYGETGTLIVLVGMQISTITMEQKTG